MLKWLSRRFSRAETTTSSSSGSTSSKPTKSKKSRSHSTTTNPATATTPSKTSKPPKKQKKDLSAEEEDEEEQLPEPQHKSTASTSKTTKKRRVRKSRESTGTSDNTVKKTFAQQSDEAGCSLPDCAQQQEKDTKAQACEEQEDEETISSTVEEDELGSDAVDHEDDDDYYVGDLEFEDDDVDDSNDFDCLSPEDILKEQQKRIRTVAELLNVSETMAAHLLRHFRWKQEQLLTRYFENPKAVLKEAGAPNSYKTEPKLAKIKGKVECLICGDEYSARKCTALSCRHTMCNECWGQYLSTKINDGAVQGLTCPAMNCKILVTEKIVKKLVDPPLFEKYVRFITKSFVEDNERATWCPRPNCGNAITSDMVSGRVVTCSCGYRFCFSCKNEAHAPATCEQVRMWLQKSRDDSETLHWVGANTKPCPSCHVDVEKNGGCCHMKCPRCQHDWCWLCLRPWKGHNDFYSCNRYEKAQKKKLKIQASAASGKKKPKVIRMEEERERQKQQLERYLHYYERYLHNGAAARMEQQIKEKAYQKIADLSQIATRAEVQFIEKGTNVLLQCRNVLKWSYVFAYYLPETGPEKELFTFLQQELEKTTEKLGEVLEAPGIMKRAETTDLTKLALKKIENLLTGVEQGLVAQV